MKNRILSITITFTALTCLATILGYLGGFYWIFDLFTHFRLQYAVILLIMFFAFLFFKKKSLAVIAIVFLIPNIYEVGSVFFGGNKNEDLQQYLKISSINLLSTNGDEQAVLSFIQSKDPDILVLQEFNERWEKALAKVMEQYPYQKVLIRTDNYGVAMLSKVEVQNMTELNLSPTAVPSLLATVSFDGQTIKILATHPATPIGQQGFEHRNDHFASIVAMKDILNESLIIIGDLNSSSYSVHFKKLIDGLNLVDSRKGFGILATWPTWFSPMKVTLDHCLISPDIFVKTREVGEPVGSDHLPIYLEVGLE